MLLLVWYYYEEVVQRKTKKVYILNKIKIKPKMLFKKKFFLHNVTLM